MRSRWRSSSSTRPSSNEIDTLRLVGVILEAYQSRRDLVATARSRLPNLIEFLQILEKMPPMIPRSLEQELRDGRVIPFVGAGVSMAVERVGGGRLFPSWKQLLLDGAARLEQEGKKAGLVRAFLEDDQPRYLEAAQELRDKLGPLWGGFLRDSLDVPRSQVADSSLELARAVWRLGSRLVVTTNYDKVLQWACPEECRADLKAWNINAPAEQAEYLRRGEVRTATVWHLHGSIDDTAELILTPAGYGTLYPSAATAEPAHQAALETLRHLLASRSFLFIGFSLDDEHFGVELQRMLDTFEGFGGPHYALVHRRDVERLRQSGKPVELIVFEDFGRPLLERLRELSQSIEPARDFGPVDVYLAEVADSQRPLRKRVYDDLTRKGLSVAWNVPPPFDAQGHRQQVGAILQRARLSVHLLDGYAGREVDGAPETTYPQEQARLARQQARSQLIWVPRHLPDLDESQQALLAELQGAGGDASRRDFLEGLPPSELVRDILARLRQDRPLPEEPQAVLLAGHPKDEKIIGEVEAFLRSYRVPTYVHRPQGDLRRDTERLVERLRTVGALVVCHGEVESSWAVSRLAEAVKAVFNTPCPLKVFCVYLAEPSEKDLQVYERFQLLRDLDRFALLVNQHGPLQATIFEPLFQKLGVRGTAPSVARANPFVGLRPFESDEAMLFFGRDEQTLELLERLQAKRFLGVVGSSGCGKSSLVRAGLLSKLQADPPELARDRWQIATLRPGSHPFAELAAALAAALPGSDGGDVPAFAEALRTGGLSPLLDATASAFERGDTSFLL